MKKSNTRRKAGQRPKVIIDEVDLKIVGYLAAFPEGLLISGVADFMNMPLNTILQRINNLSKIGLITKTNSEGRAIILQLKPEYQAILEDQDLIVHLEDGLKGLLDYLRKIKK